MAEKPTIPDFPNLPDFGQMITQACEVVASVRGIPYDFNGTLSLENKFIVLFKTVKEMFNAQDELVKSYKALYNFINSYFDNLDVQNEVNNKIQSMAEDGSLISLIAPTVATSAGEWLHNNITNPANPPIDKSLTVENAAADSKITGNNFKSVNSDISSMNIEVIKNIADPSLIRRGYYYSKFGTKIANEDWSILQIAVKPNTDYFILGQNTALSFFGNSVTNTGLGTISKNHITTPDNCNSLCLSVKSKTDNFVVIQTKNYEVSSYEEAPFNVTLKVLYNGYDLTEMSENIKKASQYDSIRAGEKVNLVTNFYTANATLRNNIVTTTGNNGILLTNKFSSNSANVRLRLTLINTIPITIYLSYFNSAGKESFKKLLDVSETGTLKQTLEIDCASFIVYNDAVNFRIRINCNAAGTLTINDFTVYEASDIETSKYYSDNFLDMTNNVFNGLNAIEQEATETKRIVLTNGKGEKYDLQVDNNGNIIAVPHIPKKVLFMGNSLVFGMNNTDDRNNAFGMAATDYTKDYVYNTEQEILKKNSKATFTRLYSSPFEHSETIESATKFINDNIAMFSSDLDLVVVQMSENVNTDKKRNVFNTSFPKLIQTIRVNSPKAKILCVGGWFAESVVTEKMLETCINYGCSYLSIHDLFTSENLGVVGATVTYKNGKTGNILEAWHTHPGDKGHKAISDKIVNALDM